MRPKYSTVDPLRLILGRAGLAKKTQTYFFFQIDPARVQDFRTQLADLVPLITTTAQAQNDKKEITKKKRSSVEKGVAPAVLTLAGVNILFSHKGLVMVGPTP